MFSSVRLAVHRPKEPDPRALHSAGDAAVVPLLSIPPVPPGHENPEEKKPNNARYPPIFGMPLDQREGDPIKRASGSLGGHLKTGMGQNESTRIWTAGLSPCFHLPGQLILVTLFGHTAKSSRVSLIRGQYICHQFPRLVRRF